MIQNYLKITLRTLFKYKTFSVINILGLGLSMSICLMIMIYIKDQKSSDRFHEKRDRIFHVYMTDKEILYSEVKGWATTFPSVAPAILDNYPSVESTARLRNLRASVVHQGTAVSISGLYAEPSFLDIFTYPLRAGDPKTALEKPFSIIISEETALKFFGNEDPMNRTLSLEQLGDFMVTGILEKNDQKSHLRFDVLASFSSIESLNNLGTQNDQGNNLPSYYTYLLLKDKSDPSLLEDQLAAVERTVFNAPQNERYDLKLQPLLKINLGINLFNHTPGTKQSFEIVFIPFVALWIVFLACFNYIILSIARSLKRTKEIGMRKVVGAKRSQIFRLFLSETLFISILALVAAILFILWLIPAFNGMDTVQNARQQINLEQLKDPVLYLLFVLFAIIIGILAGLYPSFYLSSFQPADALQGTSKVKGLSHLLVRKILMGIQFGISMIALIFIVYFYHLQVYWSALDYGLATENCVSVPIRDVYHETFRNEMISNPDITGISFSSNVPIYGGMGILQLKADNPENPKRVLAYSIDPEFIGNFDIKLIAGRNFSRDFPTDTKTAILVNERTLQAFNLGSPEESIGKTLTLENGSKIMIIGVVKNFIYSFPDEPIEPMILQYYPNEFEYANIHYREGAKETLKTTLAEAWKKFDKIHPIQFEFFDDMQARSEREVRDPLRISAWACGFVILIALMGLLGIAAYATETRIKEIGIRKVMGAHASAIVYLLSKSTIKLILISALFAIPCGYFLSASIVQSFAFRPALSLWVLPATLIFILGLALLTISTQTVKAALTNPARTLREE